MVSLPFFSAAFVEEDYGDFGPFLLHPSLGLVSLPRGDAGHRHQAILSQPHAADEGLLPTVLEPPPPLALALAGAETVQRGEPGHHIQSGGGGGGGRRVGAEGILGQTRGGNNKKGILSLICGVHYSIFDKLINRDVHNFFFFTTI